MVIYTIGFTKKSAEQFFELLKKHGIRRIVDVRLNNISQLAGFTKRDDLRYFLRTVCDADYVHEPLLAPTQAMLDKYKKGDGDWADYEVEFAALIKQRKIERHVDRALFEIPAAMLCSEPTAEHCHRRIVAEHLQKKWGDVEIVHL